MGTYHSYGDIILNSNPRDYGDTILNSNPMNEMTPTIGLELSIVSP